MNREGPGKCLHSVIICLHSASAFKLCAYIPSAQKALKSILSSFEGPGGINADLKHMLIFLVVWYILPIITYGVWVPAGLFVPGIVIGVSVGAVNQLLH